MPVEIQMTRTEDGPDAGRVATAIDDNLGYLVNRTARLMGQMFSRRLERHGVALAQWAILLFLCAGRPDPARAEPHGGHRAADGRAHHRPHGP